ncbi:MAG: RHS repeat-associated core domain-containing protein, partial [Chthonomonas sp.]|nr:RHS repeat-associated core domain-containing protein [Chthonomonas sp.]
PTTYSSGSASYDEENRLTAFPAGAQVWGAGYRADGLRAWTRKTATGAKTFCYYDQGNAVLETKADGTMVGMNIFAPDGLVTRWSKLSGTIPVVGDYQFDWQGNAVHCLFSGARYADEPLIHSAYNAWGQRNFVYSNGASSAADLLRFGYNARWGYKLDTETGLYYCQHRYYDPANGRWVTRDPIGFRGGFNHYGYCSNDSVQGVDPQGLWNFDRWLLTGDGDASDEVYEAALNAVNDGLETAGHALRNGSKFGIGDDGSHDDEPGYTEAKHLTEVAMVCLIAAGAMKGGGVNGEFQGPYKNTGGGGLKVTRNGDPWFRVEVHPWRGQPWYKWPHWHRDFPPGPRPPGGGADRHLPWE